MHRLATLLALVCGSVGCAAIHERGDDAGAIAVDADALDAGARACPAIDGGVRHDASCGLPAGEPVRPTLLCATPLPTGGGELTVRVDGCYCGERLGCSVRSAGASLAIDLLVDSSGPLCDGCFSLTTTCALLSLDFAELDVNGERVAFPIASRPTGVTACWTPIPPRGPSVSCMWPLESTMDDSECIPATAGSGAPIAVWTSGEAADAAQPAGCEVRISGGEIQVIGRLQFCMLEPSTAGRRTFPCTLPPLVAGSYRVNVSGRVHELIVSDGATGNVACAL